MAATSDQLLAVLERIDKGIAELCAMARANKQARESRRPGEPVTSEADLDSAYGNFIIKAKDPRDWSGPSMAGRTLSECPADYLDLLAERYDYFNTTLDGSKPEDAKKIGYNKKDAASARGWAARIRAGYVSPAAAASAVPEDDDIKF